MWPLPNLRQITNNALEHYEPVHIVTFTTLSVTSIFWLYEFLFYSGKDFKERVIQRLFRMIRRVPSVEAKIRKSLKQYKHVFQQDTIRRYRNVGLITTMPRDRLSNEEIMKAIHENLALGEFDWENGRVSGAVYAYDKSRIDLLSRIYGRTMFSNPLHADIFPGICKMETEVIKMIAELFFGDGNTCGSITTGGTESILMACKAYRDYAFEVRGIDKPEIVVPTTAHSAFDKAAQYLKLKIRSVPVDNESYKVDIKQMHRSITSRTIMLVGSAPNFPYGTIDDIMAISNLGDRYGIPVHVDSCLGGFITAFMNDAGYSISACDFRLPGVTSISVDTHKYGYCPKGTSVILYRYPRFLHHQYTVTTDWPGGVYGSPTVGGSRSGGNIAVCWATLLSMGYDGYVKETREIIRTAIDIEARLRDMEELFIFGQPAVSVIAIGSKVFDIFRLSELLQTAGWLLNHLQFPSGIHLCVTSMHTKPGVADAFIRDVRRSIKTIMRDPQKPVDGQMALYGASQKVSDRSIVVESTRIYLDSLQYVP